MKTIELTQGYVALVDDEDYEELDKHLWFAHADNRKSFINVYAGRKKFVKGKHSVIWMHKVILNTDNQVDHKDCNGLNNQRFNLREATNTQNMANRRKTLNKTSSKYKGVRLHKNSGWQARIQYEHLGMFESEVDAAKAYDKAAIRIYGQFARLNFPKDIPV